MLFYFTQSIYQQSEILKFYLVVDERALVREVIDESWHELSYRFYVRVGCILNMLVSIASEVSGLRIYWSWTP